MMPIPSDNILRPMPNRTHAHRNCAHCAKPATHGYPLCYPCVSSLPIALRKHLNKNYAPNGPTWRQQKHRDAIWDVRIYLDATDKTAHLWEKARTLHGWAIDALKELRLIDEDGVLELIKEAGLARLRGQGASNV